MEEKQTILFEKLRRWAKKDSAYSESDEIQECLKNFNPCWNKLDDIASESDEEEAAKDEEFATFTITRQSTTGPPSTAVESLVNVSPYNQVSYIMPT
jgi:hypothetical protein